MYNLENFFILIITLMNFRHCFLKLYNFFYDLSVLITNEKYNIFLYPLGMCETVNSHLVHYLKIPY